MAIERLTPNANGEWRALGLQHLQRYELAGRFVSGKTVLDLACGNGYGAYTLMNLGARSVNAVDLDSTAIEYAKAHYARNRLEYHCEDCFRVAPVDAGYEVIVSFETIEHLQEPKKFIRKLRDLIAKDGRLVISAPNTLQYQKAPQPVVNPYHFSEPTYGEFREWVETEFVVDQEWEQSPITMSFGRQSALVEKSGLIRGILGLECAIKRMLGKPSLKAMTGYADLHEARSQVFTHVFPLLPERRQAADVFIFVCTPRN